MTRSLSRSGFVLFATVMLMVAFLAGKDPCKGIIEHGKVSRVDTKAILNLAKEGQLIMVLRHTEKHGKTVRDDCKDPDNALSEDGIGQAEELGRDLQKLGLSFTEVRSSRYCRTLQTAEFVNPCCKPRRDNDLVSNCRATLKKQEEPLTNLLLVTHSTCLERLLDLKCSLEAEKFYGLSCFWDRGGNLNGSPIGCLYLSDW